MLAYDYPLLGFFWSVFILFLWLTWFMLVFRIIVDVFRSKDLGGVSKAIWLLFVAFLPFLGVFIYLIARGGKMAERELSSAQAQQQDFEQYVRSVGTASAADELAKLADLHAKGVLTDAELAAQKAKILAG